MAKMFFCEACGRPVALKASKCPHCGRLFDSVKCPKCSFSGGADLFTNGCPSCGYLSRGKSGGSLGSRDLAVAELENGLVKPDSEGLTLGLGQTGGGGAGSLDRKKRNSRQLPNWAYTLLTAVLIVLLIVFIVVYLRL